MSALDKTIPPLALNLINNYGTTCILNVNTAGAYNPATAKPTIVTVSQTIKGLIEEYADNLRFLGDKSTTANTVVEGDKKVSIAASGLISLPKVNDSITVQGVSYNIQGVGSMWSGELVALYVLHVRKN